MMSIVFCSRIMLTKKYSDYDQRILLTSLVLCPWNGSSKSVWTEDWSYPLNLSGQWNIKHANFHYYHIANSFFSLHACKYLMSGVSIDWFRIIVLHKMVWNKRIEWEQMDFDCLVFLYFNFECNLKSVSLQQKFGTFKSLAYFGTWLVGHDFYFTQETNFEHKDSNTICCSYKTIFQLLFLSSASSRII